MKNKAWAAIAGILIVAMVAGTFVLIWRITSGDDTGIPSGTYHVSYSANDTNASLYPDACVIVENGTLRLINIDLNELYREKQTDLYNSMLEPYSDSLAIPVSEEEMERNSDLNAMFVENPYELVNAKIVKREKNLYDYSCRTELSFGLSFTCDIQNNSISIVDDEDPFTFVKE